MLQRPKDSNSPTCAEVKYHSTAVKKVAVMLSDHHSKTTMHLMELCLSKPQSKLCADNHLSPKQANSNKRQTNVPHILRVQFSKGVRTYTHTHTHTHTTTLSLTDFKFLISSIIFSRNRLPDSLGLLVRKCAVLQYGRGECV